MEAGIGADDCLYLECERIRPSSLLNVGSRPSSWLLFYQETHHENRQVFLQPLLPEDQSTNRVVGHQIHTVLSTACKNPGERIVPPDCPQQILSENSRFNSNWF